MEIPVYLFTGFLESGKTTFIKDTAGDRNFTNGSKSLIIMCEEGMEEIDESTLKVDNAVLEVVDEEEQLTTEYLEGLMAKHLPERVFIELNGMWDTQRLLQMKMPKYWEIVQIITLVNCETYDMYMSNMRSMLVNHYSDSDMVIFNRCTKANDRAAYRRSIKAVNRKAQVYFEGEGIDPNDTTDLLPFDMNADVIEIEDDDYGIWYLDAMDNPKKYVNKTLKFRAIVFKPKGSTSVIVPGRHAMTCCADDVQFIGFVCKGKEVENLQTRQWIEITAEAKYEFRKEYRGKGLVLYAKEVEMSTKPEEELVYFY